MVSISYPQSIEALAQKPDNGGNILSLLAGLGAPIGNNCSRCPQGINGGTTKAHLARAVLEGFRKRHFGLWQVMEHL